MYWRNFIAIKYIIIIEFLSLKKNLLCQLKLNSKVKLQLKRYL